ncbi:hypothetical protein [Sorangium sp. So ce388]|uniref:hypothetical protein n=1 Tax=Sorangium sp. So ce388 TaxID=3133309 RepID=UPI003F5CA1F4
MTPPGGPILPIVRTATVDRRDLALPVCWVRRPGARGTPVAADPFVPLGDRLGPGVLGGDAVAFLLGPEPPGVAIEALLAEADRGSRVYVLASPGFGEGRGDPGLNDRRQARILVRRIEGLPLSGVMSGRGARAGVWLGQAHGAAPRWWLPLSSAQGQALFRVFLHLFWHHAREEAWTTGGPLAFRKAGERPFDAPLPRPAAPVRLLLGDAPALEGSAGDVLYLPGGTVPKDARRPALLFTPPSGAGQEQLASLVRADTRVVWEDLDLPAFRVGAAGGEMEAVSGRMRVRLSLDGAQAEGLRRAAALAERQATYRLCADIALGAVEGDVWLPGQARSSPLAPTATIDAEATEAGSLRDMATTPARTLPDPPPLALRVEYRWTALPPRAHAGAADDPLVVAWRQLDTEAQKRIDGVRRCLIELERKERALAVELSALAGTLLGFGHQRDRLLKELDTLAADRGSRAEPEATRRLFERLVRLEEAAHQLDDSVAVEERKERERQERERQERTWRARREEAAQSAEASRVELRRLTDEQARSKNELGELERGSHAGDPKDREARMARLRDDIRRLAGRLRQLEADIDRNEKNMAEAFEFRPARPAPGMSREEKRSAHQARFVPRTSARPVERDIPREAPPKVGRLLRWKEARHLVIDRWEDLDDGEREAQRLGARLVAPAEDA